MIGNAGGAKTATAREIDESLLKDTLDLNLVSNVLLTKHALPHLEKTKGNIAFISSVAGMGPPFIPHILYFCKFIFD